MSLLLFLILYIVFWVLYYYLESRHDAAVILWKNSSADRNQTKEDREVSDKHRKNWHYYDMLEKSITHIVITLPVLLIGGSIWLLASLLLLSLGIRLIIHNLLINKFLGIDINHIGTTDWVDILFREFESNGISQWTIKVGIIFITIMLSILFLLI